MQVRAQFLARQPAYGHAAQFGVAALGRYEDAPVRAPRIQPGADGFLAHGSLRTAPVRVHAGRVDQVAAGFTVGVQQGKRGLAVDACPQFGGAQAYLGHLESSTWDDRVPHDMHPCPAKILH